MVDLDLDVVQRGDGEIEVHDEDEFAHHQVALGYSSAMVEGALKATSAVVAALEAGDEPFGSVWVERMAAAKRLAGVDGG